MKNYVIFDTVSVDANGLADIVQEGSCPDSAFEAQLRGKPQSYAIAEGVGNSLEHVFNTRTGRVNKRKAVDATRRRANLDAAMELSPEAIRRAGRPERAMKIFAHLKAQGIDLGPDGADL